APVVPRELQHRHYAILQIGVRELRHAIRELDPRCRVLASPELAGQVPLQRLEQGLRHRQRDPSEPADTRCLHRHTTLIYAIAAVPALRGARPAPGLPRREGERGSTAAAVPPNGPRSPSRSARIRLNQARGDPGNAPCVPPGPSDRCAVARTRRPAPAAWTLVVATTA